MLADVFSILLPDGRFQADAGLHKVRNQTVRLGFLDQLLGFDRIGVPRKRDGCDEYILRRPDAFVPLDLRRRRTLDIRLPGTGDDSLGSLCPLDQCVIRVDLAVDFHTAGFPHKSAAFSTGPDSDGPSTR